jgi:hypothetical protein
MLQSSPASRLKARATEHRIQVTRNHVRAAAETQLRSDDFCAVELTAAVRNDAASRDAARRHGAP